MSDLISRAELFDELNRRGVPYNAEVNMVINGMPSAQPKTQLSTEDATFDCISRRAAIEAVSTMFAPTPTQMDMREDCLEILENLPSAQPEPIKINIDHELTKEEYEKLRKDMADAPIVLLPSAQPEVLACGSGELNAQPERTGRWEQVEINYFADMDEEIQEAMAIASMFCPRCKRYHNEVYLYGDATYGVNFCPNCGADMRGEEHD